MVPYYWLHKVNDVWMFGSEQEHDCTRPAKTNRYSSLDLWSILHVTAGPRKLNCVEAEGSRRSGRHGVRGWTSGLVDHGGVTRVRVAPSPVDFNDNRYTICRDTGVSRVVYRSILADQIRPALVDRWRNREDAISVIICSLDTAAATKVMMSDGRVYILCSTWRTTMNCRARIGHVKSGLPGGRGACLGDSSYL